MFHATTILAVRANDRTVLAGDGQVTFGQTVMKQGARKIRRLYHDQILAGFAGSAADSFALFSRFEAKLEQYRGNLERSASNNRHAVDPQASHAASATRNSDRHVVKGRAAYSTGEQP